MAGFWQNVLSRVNPGTWLSPRVTYLGGEGSPAPLRSITDVDFGALTVPELWTGQPHLRTVVAFRARNVAHLGLHVFERVSDTDRKRDRSSPLAVALRAPDLEATTYDLIFGLVGDLDLYDRAYWLTFWDEEGNPRLRRLPPSWVSPVMRNPWEVKHFEVSLGDRTVKVPREQVIRFGGYAPGSPAGSSPTLDSLKDTLREQVEAAKYRQQVWRRGGRVSSVLQRPKDAPAWSPEAAERFRADWYANYTGKGDMAGGTPILEDGMTLNKVDFSARDQQYVEASKLSLATVASSFHINPTMVGQMEGATYSNVREFRRMLYGDSLGPTLTQIQSVVNQYVIPALGMDPARHYAEFNVQQKLEGSFEEQAAVMQTMVGAPVMTRNEGRAKFNLPRVEGADELIVPLNVIEGGQASPTDAGSQNRRPGGESSGPALEVKGAGGGVRFKAMRRSGDEEEALSDLFSEFFKRQGRAVSSRIFAKSQAWWDSERWDEELSDLILSASAPLVLKEAGVALSDLGLPEDAFDLGRTTEFRKAVAQRIASQVNEATMIQIVEALKDPDGQPREAVARVFDDAAGPRSKVAGTTAFATFAGFAVNEAAKQSRPRARKRWIVTSGNPRASHAALSGVEVGIDESFPNGLKWPGSYSGNVDEVANCRCEISIVI